MGLWYYRVKTCISILSKDNNFFSMDNRALKTYYHITSMFQSSKMPIHWVINGFVIIKGETCTLLIYYHMNIS